jgi:serine protease Do
MISSRCGRQPWENAATPVDRLRERMAEFAAGMDEDQMRLGLDDVDDDVRTRFTRGGDRSGRMAVQRALPLDEVVGRAEASMLRILDGTSTGCYATAVDADGHAVSKRSQLPTPDADGWLRAEDREGATRRVRIVGTDGPLDLALLEVEGAPLPPIAWELGAKLVPGQVLLTPRFGPTGPALGFAAIERRESERDWRSGPYLGVRTEPVARADAREAGVESAVRVLEVVPDAPASKAGIRVGDLLVSLDDQPLSGREGLRRRIFDRAVGDRVRIDLLRDGERLDVEATLATRASDGDGGIQRGNTVTPISAVSTGFGEVIAHDAIVWPEQCGGPIVDLDGRAVGLNIARYDRTATHALDPVRVEAAVRRMREAAARTGEPTQPAAANDTAEQAP